MKNFSKILVTLGVTLFLLSFGMKSEAEAQPPCTNLKDTLTIGGCPYEFDICVYCGLSYPGYVNVNSYRNLDSSCHNSLNGAQIMQQALTQFGTSASIWLNYCQPLVPPCLGQDRKVVTWNVAMCWKAKLDKINILPDENIYIFLPCDTDIFCAVEYEYCIDANGMLQSNLVSNTSHGFPLCYKEGYQIIMPTTYVGEESECYILHTPCNP